MAKYSTQIDSDVRDVLTRSAITSDSVTLPTGQLERPLYERVDKVLVAAGGKWNRSRRAHVFWRDPREALGLALETGSIVNERKANQQFFTPDGLASQLVDAAQIQAGMLVLEPSAGAGAIARHARQRGAVVWCVERDIDLARGLVADGFATFPTDFLTLSPGAPRRPADLPRYSRIVMNPPFANQQDIDHVEHAFRFVEGGGVLVAVMSASVKTNTTKKATAFRRLIELSHGSVESLPDDAFSDSGTNVRTVMVRLEKFRL